jgi:Tfp pilus assembly protein PilF
LLHAAVCLLLFACLRRRIPEAAAGAAALLFAVLPVHAEAVSYVTSRSELLAALSLLGCWWSVGGARGKPRLAAGLLCFAAGLLSKESAVVIPAFLLLEDWVFDGRLPWHPERRAVNLGLAAVAAAYLVLRLILLPRASAGVPFFASRLDAAEIWPAWAARHYLWPALSGLGLCADFTRAGSRLSFSNPGLGQLFALRLLPALPIIAAIAATQRARWAFWLLGPALFLLPTCPLLVPLDTIGAERFLYIPTIGLVVALGWAFERLRLRRPAAAWAALSALALWYGGALVARNGVWLTERGYFEASCACNPASAHARSGLGEAKLGAGDEEGGRAELERAIALDPGLPDPVYNLALLAFKRGQTARAEELARRALSLDAGSSDAWVLLALAVQKRGARAEAEAALRRALALLPWNAPAELDLGRLLLEEGRAPEAAAHLRRFVELAPGDPDAPRVAALLRQRS